MLKQYVKDGIGELAQDKHPVLLELKYSAVSDAAIEQDSVAGIREVFVRFQKYLYE